MLGYNKDTFNISKLHRRDKKNWQKVPQKRIVQTKAI